MLFFSHACAVLFVLGVWCSDLIVVKLAVSRLEKTHYCMCDFFLEASQPVISHSEGTAYLAGIGDWRRGPLPIVQ